jgi:hypothetical protein
MASASIMAYQRINNINNNVININNNQRNISNGVSISIMAA